ncbi:leucine carboxyl methyltransferase 2 [Fusarium oxysporum f. sp. lycopersici 4287]|uniref:tRNA wybutosine-synthesizing protein 4 n=2 Tax=Fusarium oxysporum TaxID=5507 RepID=A0A0J9WT39_FUSO4|nr:leucine carboxyl methyltransferase 2 [Fusarium oxysporum f. sp. lycopersici 4287]KNB15362.1 leucine carboxyl methyltransferase 2 [Fusarium oxysporum f. sp. lycopersici 4287]
MMAKGNPPSTKVARTQALDDLIMGTNSSSIVSKRSVERLYYPDELHFFRYFVNKFQRRAPLINRGYWLRLRVIDVIVRQFVTSPKPGRKKVVINLGAGSDVLPWQSYHRYGDSCENTLFIDVDYPDLMLKKRAIVLGTPQLHELLGDSPAISEKVTDQILLRSDKYCQIGCDLRELESLRNCLESFLNLAECSVLFVAEVSITYMDTFSADALVQWASSIGQAEFCLLEQILPHGPEHPFASTMLKHFNKLNTPLKSVDEYPTVESQRHRFQERGWSSVDVWDLWDAWNSDLFLDSTERAALDNVEPFDEWEEFILFSRHYVVLHATAYHRDERGAGQRGQVGVSNKHVKANVTSLGSLGAPKRRFGAPLIASSPEGDKYLVNALGMGIKARLDSCDIYSLQQDSMALEISPAGPTARLCHATVDIGHLGTLLVGGRASPSKALNDCWIFKKDSNRWEKTFDLPAPLFRHCAVHLPGSSLALVLGGKTGPSEISPDYYVFHPVKGWLKCSVTGAIPSSTFGTIAVASPNPGSKYGTFQGLMAGGISKYGKINEQAYFWTINVSTDVSLTLMGIQGHFQSLVPKQQTWSPCTSYAVVWDNIHPHIGQSMACISVKDGHLEVFNVDLRNEVGQLPFMVGSATVSSGSELVVLGGGATCFSMGTFWDTGVYKVDLTNAISEMPYIQPANCKPVSINYQDSPKLTHQTTTIERHQPTLKPSIKSIARIKLQSKLDFEQLVENRKPVIIESLDLGSCVAKWSPEYMVQRVGQTKEIVVHECQSSTGKMDFNSKNFRYVTEPFSSFMAKAARGEAVYLRALSEAKPTESPANLQDDFPTLADDFQLPEELSLIKDRMFSSVLRISGRAKMWLHYDVMANVYTQIQGSKRMVLMPPTDVNNLAFAPGASSSSLDVLSALDKQEFVSTNPYEAILNPGDLLFIPAMWLHTASPTTDLSVAVNVFFRDLDSGYSTGRDVYGNRDLAAYEKARQDISRIVKIFDRLPSEIRDFYLTRLADELLHKQH